MLPPPPPPLLLLLLLLLPILFDALHQLAENNGI
jgi:hypothetical protein